MKQSIGYQVAAKWPLLAGRVNSPAEQIVEFARVREQAEDETPLPKPVSAARVDSTKLRNLRQQRNASLVKLSRRTGITKSNLSRLDNSDNAKVQTRKRYADASSVMLVIDVKEPTAG